MFTTRCTSKTKHSRALKGVMHSGIYNALFGASIAVASAVLLTACGQKGELTLVDPSGQAVRDSTAILGSGSNPQDAAFAKIDGNQDSNAQNNNAQNNEQNTEGFQLPEPSSDPNDY